MPVHRELVAASERLRLEHVRAPSHGPAWGAVHQAEETRCILPGLGAVQWRSQGELLVVDPLTAFCLHAGESYQLRHEGERAHFVLASGPQQPALLAARASLLAPRDLFQLAACCRRLQRGDASVADVAARLREATARAHPIDAAQIAPVLAQARRFMALQAGTRLSLAEIGEEVRCSAFGLTRLFRRHLRITPHRYRQWLRLALAIREMERGETDLAGLAHDLGFCSQSHFGQAFRVFVGTTPAAARHALA